MNLEVGKVYKYRQSDGYWLTAAYFVWPGDKFVCKEPYAERVYGWRTAGYAVFLDTGGTEIFISMTELPLLFEEINDV